MTNDQFIQQLRRVRSAAVNFLSELDSLPINPAPEKTRKRQDLKTGRIDQFERNHAAGTWTKPAGLKKRK